LPHRCSKRRADIGKQRDELAKSQAAIDEQVAEKVQIQRGAIAAEEARKAKLSLGNELDQKAREVLELQTVLKERDVKLNEAQKAQAEMLRTQRELDDAKRELELTVEKRVQESLAQAEERARQRIEGDTRLKMAEKDKVIADAQRQIDEMKRKMEQGSQQLQGEVQELELEGLLRAKFPRDTIEPVPKGEFGGDAVHRVFGGVGQECGTILWESKRTKNWSDAWLVKLRDDQRAAKADLCVLVTQVLPKDIEHFAPVDGVWVVSPRYAIGLALALRQTLIEVSCARQTSEGQQSKMEMVYQYLVGPGFRHRIEAIVEKFTELQEDLEKERRWTTKMWAKREEQIRCVVEATAGMYGDLQGIAGKSLREIEGLGEASESPMLE